MDTCQLVLTGGGTVGHVAPNLVLIDQFKEDYRIAYLGHRHGFEAELVDQVPFYHVPSGKLRRYWSWRNFVDPFIVIYGIYKAWRLLGRLRPKLVFSKGGFVALPVVIAAYLRKIPIIAHESDATPGITTKMTARIATEVWCHYQSALDALHKRFKGLELKHVPLLVRPKILAGEEVRGLEKANFSSSKPVILVMGGSLGAESVNALIDRALAGLLEDFQIIHLTGRGKEREAQPGYYTSAYAGPELADFYAAASLVIGRSGATSLAEWGYWELPSILCPLGGAYSRGEQQLNAQAYLQTHPGEIIEEDQITPEELRQLCQKYALVSNKTKAPARAKLDTVINIYKDHLQPYLTISS